jgi:hypothetical protein
VTVLVNDGSASTNNVSGLFGLQIEGTQSKFLGDILLQKFEQAPERAADW